ncbi:hypothetical protein CIK05_08275 [Bdellovibrio sp. qaytius]|nr:hypothetical protein CIK05_08275 [Bdellovibrio sp. qaytius]
MFLIAQDSLKKLKNMISDFLFGEGHFERLGVFRFLIFGVMFYIACYRQMNVDQYGPDALIPGSQAFDVFSDFYRPYVKLFFWPDQLASTVHIAYIALLALATVGLSNRPLMIFTWVIAQGFIQRNFSILFGADVIGTLFMFYLAFTRCNEYFSLRRMISKKRVTFNPKLWSDQLSTMFFRLLQIQLFTIYAYTGFEKLKGSTWWDGTALWTVLVNPQFTSFDLLFLKDFPIFFAVGTFVTIIFEVYFWVMVSNKKTRPLWLVMGVGFHLMIGVLLGLMSFSLVMISTYVLFVYRSNLRQCMEKVLPKNLQRLISL